MRMIRLENATNSPTVNPMDSHNNDPPNPPNGTNDPHHDYEKIPTNISTVPQLFQISRTTFSAVTQIIKSSQSSHDLLNYSKMTPFDSQS